MYIQVRKHWNPANDCPSKQLIPVVDSARWRLYFEPASKVISYPTNIAGRLPQNKCLC